MCRRDWLFGAIAVGALLSIIAMLFPRATATRRSAARLVASRTPSANPMVHAAEALDKALPVARKHTARRRVEFADELTVARRLALGLVGTIPSLEEIRWIEEQPAEERIPRWTERLLADRRWADYAAERLARAYVGTEVGPFLVYRRRRFVSWLAEQLYAGRPYDAVVREMIAAEGHWTDKPATNFITVTIEPQHGPRPNAARLAGRVTRAFLGLRLDCAECHDHPFAPWKQDDFHGLAAFFGPTRQGFGGIEDGQDQYKLLNRAMGERQQVDPKVPFGAEWLPREGHLRARLAAWVTDPQNKSFGLATANRVWALVCGLPLVEPIDDVTGETPPALSVLADDFASGGYDMRRLIRGIAFSEAIRREGREHVAKGDSAEVSALSNSWSAFPMSRLRPEQLSGAILQASSLVTIDRESPVLVRFARLVSESQFVGRFGDAGDQEFDERPETIPQRLLLMNGQLVQERTKQDLSNAATRIALLAPDDATAVETAYLAVLTRRPSPAEQKHFVARLAGARRNERQSRLEDLYWSLINSTEFAWNH